MITFLMTLTNVGSSFCLKEESLSRLFSLIYMLTGTVDYKVQMISPEKHYRYAFDLSITPKAYEGDYHDEGSQYLMASLDDLKLLRCQYSPKAI